MDKDLKKVIMAAQAGGKILKKYFGTRLKIEIKSSPADFRTRADVESERAVLAVLKKHFPTYNVMAEESGLADHHSAYQFYVDPLDGSNNYILGLPYFSVGLALLYKQTGVLAVCYDPIRNNTYYAKVGKGAYLNGRRITVSKVNKMAVATLAYNASYLTPRREFRNFFQHFYQYKFKRMMTNWSVGLDYCLLASGKIDAVINCGSELYDYLPGKIMALEAGGKITDFSGRQEKDFCQQRFLASNGTALHEQLLRSLPFKK